MKKQQHNRFEILDHLMQSGMADRLITDGDAAELIRVADFIENGDPYRPEPESDRPHGARLGPWIMDEAADFFDLTKKASEPKKKPEPQKKPEASIFGMPLSDLLGRGKAPEGVELGENEYWCPSCKEAHPAEDSPLGKVPAGLSKLMDEIFGAPVKDAPKA